MNGAFTSGGLQLARYLAVPAGRNDGLPGVILCHGFPIGPLDARQSGLTFPELIDRIANEQRWAAMMFNFRGCGTSEGDFSLQGWVDDLRAAIDHLIVEAAPTGVWLVGTNTGGALTVGRMDEAVAAGDTTPGTAPGTGDDQLVVVDLHEVRSINAGLKELESMGFGIESLLPQDRTGSDQPRYTLRRGDNEIGIQDLRGLLTAVRRAGEKGLSITRFKGLGEMNAEELRDTTLDPKNRTLLRVTMADAAAADDLFRILMGEKVEPRRDFIEKHALDVKNLDV